MTQREQLELKLTEIHIYAQIAGNHLEPIRTGKGSTNETSIGINLNALEWATGRPIFQTLWRWEALIRKRRNLTPPALLKTTRDDITTAILFQKAHLDWIIEQEQLIKKYATDINELHKDGQIATRSRPEPVRRIPCPSPKLKDDGTETSCRNILAIEKTNIDKEIHCHRCNTTWTVARLVNVALATSNATFWLDAESIGEWIGISERHVRRLARAWQLDKRGSLYPFQTFVWHYRQDSSE